MTCFNSGIVEKGLGIDLLIHKDYNGWILLVQLPKVNLQRESCFDR